MGGVGEAIVAVVAWVASAIGTQTVTAFVIRLALTTAISAALRALQPKPKSMDQGTVLQTKVDPAYPREVAVGKFATGGSLAYENVSGADNAYLWRVIVLSDCEIEEVTQVNGNGDALTFSGDIHTGLRACTSHFQDPSGADMLSVRIYKGTSTQTADADLDAALPEITSNFRLRGCAYALVRMQWNSEAWQSGSELVFVGKGAKCYDPRTATTVWTENAALIARQYLKGFTNNGIVMVGVGCSDSDLPDADWISAADECDEAVSLAAGGTEARYRAGGMINSREEPRSVLADFAAAMGGTHIDTGGLVIMLPGVTRAAVMDISEEDLRANTGILYAARRTSDERVNCIASTFVNPDDNWQEAPLPPRKNATRITNDGARYESGRAYRFVYSKTQGQRLDEIELRNAGYEGMLSFSAPLWGFELTPGDLFTMTSERWGGVQKLWEVQTVELVIINGKSTKSEPEARCAILACETGADVYSWTTGDEITVASGAVTQPAALPAIPEFNNNAAAIAGGLTSGDIYFNKDGGFVLATVVASTLSVTLNRYAQTKTRSGAGDVTSDAYTATVAGGSGTYEYVWEKYYGDGTINSPTSSSTTFTQTLAISETKQGKFRLTVTDTVNNISAVVTCGFTGTETT